MTQEPSLLERAEFEGLWWFPEKPYSRVAGTAAFSAETGVMLKLKGALDEESPFGTFPEPPARQS
jgi:hypothetical protein